VSALALTEGLKPSLQTAQCCINLISIETDTFVVSALALTEGLKPSLQTAKCRFSKWTEVVIFLTLILTYELIE
jgi:hypothetical protein